MESNNDGYTLGHNLFSDFTEAERRSTLGFKESPAARRAAGVFKPAESNAILPTSWDWREHNKVTPVKNQA